MNNLDIFHNQKTIQTSLQETKNYRPLDPGSYLYRIIMEYNFEKKFTKIFIELVYVTLSAWNMNSRGAKLQEFEPFRKSIIKSKKSFTLLRNYRLNDMGNTEVSTLLEGLFNSLDLVAEGKPPLVTFSKTLHFFLPELVVPIDRTYTMTYFYNNTNVPNTYASQFKRFIDIELECCSLSKRINLSKYKDKIWNSTIPKIIDNMIIGYLRLRKRTMIAIENIEENEAQNNDFNLTRADKPPSQVKSMLDGVIQEPFRHARLGVTPG